MSSLLQCVWSKRLLSSIIRIGMLAATLTAAGCASDKEYRQQAQAGQAYAVAAPTAPARKSDGQVEDDGLPPQVPPPANRMREPDDPSEPYSPNYGGAPVRRAEALSTDGASLAHKRIAAAH